MSNFVLLPQIFTMNQIYFWHYFFSLTALADPALYMDTPSPRSSCPAYPDLISSSPGSCRLTSWLLSRGGVRICVCLSVLLLLLPLTANLQFLRGTLQDPRRQGPFSIFVFPTLSPSKVHSKPATHEWISLASHGFPRPWVKPSRRHVEWGEAKYTSTLWPWNMDRSES